MAGMGSDLEVMSKYFRDLRPVFETLRVGSLKMDTIIKFELTPTMIKIVE
jgi:hypothetical protein